MSQYIRWPGTVTSVNGLTGNLTLVAGSNITITPSGQNLTISASGGGGGSGFDTIGTIDTGVASANGLNASGTTLFAQSASATVPGLVNLGAQVFAGAKTFNGALTLATLTASRAVVSDGSKALVSSATTATEIGYVSGVTSAIQTQLDAKQASGNYITALTGDGTAAGPGSAALTLATVNSNVGSFTYGAFTVNAKGLITAASSGTAPVTSVGLAVPATSIFGVTGSPVTTTGTLTLTTTGTSGGVPYFSSSSALSSSAALTANALVLGGGAGSAPAVLGSLGTTSTVLHGNAAGAPSFAAVALTSDVTGTLPIGNGGTGQTSFGSGVIQSNGTTLSSATVGISNGGTGQTTKAPAFDALSPMTTGGDVIYGGTSGTGTRLANGSAGQFLMSNGGTAAPSWSAVALAPPTVQNFTSGSGTYNKNYTFVITSGSATVGATYTHNAITYTVYATVASATQVVMSGSAAPLSSGTLTKASGTGDSTLTFTQALSPLYIRVRAVGGGGGGGATGTSPVAATAGGNTTFGSTIVVANGGALGGVGTGGAGGSASLGTGAVGIAISGGSAGSANNLTNGSGGVGGTSFFGGAGSGGYTQNSGTDAAANSGSGGGGAGSLASGSGAAGGGAGGFAEALISAPSATYAYAVGSAGTRGTAGSGGGAAAGGNGALGRIIVEEYYQ